MAAIVALGIIGWGVYSMYCMTLSSIEKQKSNNDMSARDQLPLGYEEASNDVVDPQNYRSDPCHQPIEVTERGPFGVPRQMRNDNGGWTSPFFGINHDVY